MMCSSLCRWRALSNRHTRARSPSVSESKLKVGSLASCSVVVVVVVGGGSSSTEAVAKPNCQRAATKRHLRSSAVVSGSSGSSTATASRREPTERVGFEPSGHRNTYGTAFGSNSYCAYGGPSGWKRPCSVDEGSDMSFGEAAREVRTVPSCCFSRDRRLLRFSANRSSDAISVQSDT
uniref:Uncharacterized protein n=1 Tax=Anopheles farauti TaxID=69004 RepID=A0A182QSZ3_9DIPT